MPDIFTFSDRADGRVTSSLATGDGSTRSALLQGRPAGFRASSLRKNENAKRQLNAAELACLGKRRRHEMNFRCQRAGRWGFRLLV